MKLRTLTATAAVLILAEACTANPQMQPKTLSSSRIAETVADTVSIEEDLSVFTLFALLNAAGYDHENAPTGMHPIRVEVRRDLAERIPSDLKTKLRDFYSTHPNATPWHYSVVALATSGPPDFVPTAEWKELAEDPQFGTLAELHPLLRDFYRRVDIPALYARVRPSYLSYISAYDRAVRRETTAVLVYLRVGADNPLVAGAGEHHGARIIPNLLESYEKAFSFILQDRFISIEGPQREVGYNPHEFVHAVTNPLSYDPRYAMVQRKTEILLPEARQALGDIASMKSASAYLDENLVRAIALRYLAGTDALRRAKLEAVMLEEWRQGWILERFFWDQLARMEEGSATLAASYPAMLQALDPAVELQRWKAARR